jgi:hypothetical protein
MSPLGDHLVFWATGLLAGTLLGWMLERRRVEATGRDDGKAQAALSLASREPRRVEQVQANRSARPG